MAEKRKAQRRDTSRKGRTAGRDMSTPLSESKFDSRDLNRDGKVTAQERLQAAAGRMIGDERAFYNPQMDREGKAMREEFARHAQRASDYFAKKLGARTSKD
jgi:hypothetical protein